MTSACTLNSVCTVYVQCTMYIVQCKARFLLGKQSHGNCVKAIIYMRVLEIKYFLFTVTSIVTPPPLHPNLKKEHET